MSDEPPLTPLQQLQKRYMGLFEELPGPNWKGTKEAARVTVKVIRRLNPGITDFGPPRRLTAEEAEQLIEDDFA